MTAELFLLSHVLLLIYMQNITLAGSGKTATGLHVIFKDVTLFTTGLYGCEASADPSFHTQLTRKHLTVLGEFLCCAYCILSQRRGVWQTLADTVCLEWPSITLSIVTPYSNFCIASQRLMMVSVYWCHCYVLQIMTSSLLHSFLREWWMVIKTPHPPLGSYAFWKLCLCL